jgi:hypothetical protein
MSSSPHCPDVVVGCSQAETLASHRLATAGTPSTASVKGWERFCAGAADGRRLAPCWVLKEQPCTAETPGCCFGTAKHGLGIHTVRESRPSGCVPWGLVFSGGVVGWLLVENCTVDASILFSVG